jgi:indole-3-glycerol phosphate synthase
MFHPYYFQGHTERIKDYYKDWHIPVFTTTLFIIDKIAINR